MKYSENIACEIAPGKNLKLDFALAAKPAGMSYYRLNEASNSWEKIQTLEPLLAAADESTNQIKTTEAFLSQEKKEEPKEATIDRIQISEYQAYSELIYEWPIDSFRKGTLDQAFKERFPLPEAMVTFLESNPKFYISISFDISDVTREIVSIRPRKNNPTNEFDEFIISSLKQIGKYRSISRVGTCCIASERWPHEIAFRAVTKPEAANAQMSSRTIDKGAQQLALTDNAPNTQTSKAYADLITGLSISRFGVYNCDSEFIIQDPIGIQATLMDSKNDSLLFSGGSSMQVLFESINAAYTYNPRYLTLSASDNCSILCITGQGEIYLATSKDLQRQRIKSAGAQTIRMKNITADAKDSEALAKIIMASF